MSNSVEIVKGNYDALAQGDIPKVLASLDREIEWTEAEGFPTGGTYIGPQAVAENVFARLVSDFDNFAAAPSEFIDAGDQVVVLGEYSGAWKATGKPFEAAFAHVWNLDGGKVVRFRQIVDSALVQAAMNP